MLAISVVAYLVANAFYEFQIFLLWDNCASGVNAGRLSLSRFSCFLLEDHSSSFTYTTDILVGKQQNVHVATSSTSICTSEHTFSPEYVGLCYTGSILTCSKAYTKRTPSECYWFTQEVELIIFAE